MNSATVLNNDLTPEQAIKMAIEIERVESALKQMKDQLKKYVSKNGKISTDEKVWDFSESVSWSFDANGLRKVAEGIVLDGKNPWEYLSISPAKLKSLDWKEENLVKLGKKSTRKNFKGLKLDK